MVCLSEQRAEVDMFALLVFQNSMISSGLMWEDLLHPLYQKYKNHITWGDQDLLNIIFHYNPGNMCIHLMLWMSH